MLRVRPYPRNTDAKASSLRAQLPLLDRLLDPSPYKESAATVSSQRSLALLRHSVRRDLEALLNTRRRWRSWPASLTELATSPVGFGIPDFGAGAFNDPQQREELRLEIEDTIRRFEPRFMTVTVALLTDDETLSSQLRLRIDAVLHADPAPEPIAFDTVFDAAIDNVTVIPRDSF
jgi:type VI secretion system protein ImpF